MGGDQLASLCCSTAGRSWSDPFERRKQLPQIASHLTHLFHGLVLGLLCVEELACFDCSCVVCQREKRMVSWKGVPLMNTGPSSEPDRGLEGPPEGGRREGTDQTLALCRSTSQLAALPREKRRSRLTLRWGDGRGESLSRWAGTQSGSELRRAVVAIRQSASVHWLRFQMICAGKAEMSRSAGLSSFSLRPSSARVGSSPPESSRG